MAKKPQQITGQIDTVAVVYNIYRILLPLVLLVTSISPSDTLLGEFDQTLFVQVCAAYAIFGVILTFLAPTGRKFLKSSNFQTGALIIDILSITLLVYSSGGISSGLGMLLIVTVASGSILIRGRISVFLAAVAALAIMYCELYLALVLNDSGDQLFQTGVLGIILFITSLLIQSITDRFYKTATPADGTTAADHSRISCAAISIAVQPSIVKQAAVAAPSALL